MRNSIEISHPREPSPLGMILTLSNDIEREFSATSGVLASRNWMTAAKNHREKSSKIENCISIYLYVTLFEPTTPQPNTESPRG